MSVKLFVSIRERSDTKSRDSKLQDHPKHVQAWEKSPYLVVYHTQTPPMRTSVYTARVTERRIND